MNLHPEQAAVHQPPDQTGWRWNAAACVLIAAAVLAFIPVSCPALSYFDPPKRMLCALLALLLLARRVLQPVRFDAVDTATLLLVSWIAVRAASRAEPWSEWVVVVNWLLPALIFLGARGAPSGLLRVATRTIALSGVLQALLMLLQRAGHDPLFGFITGAMSYHPGRMVGTIGYQNQAVDLLALAVFSSWVAFRSRLLRWTLLVPLLLAIVLTAHRGGIAALCTAGAITWLSRPASRRRRIGRMTIIALLVAAAGFVAPAETRARFVSAMGHPRSDMALQSRLHMSGAALDLFTAHPFAGSGPGSYALNYMDLLGQRLPEHKDHHLLPALVYAREAHQDWLQFLAEFGGIGAGLGLLVLVLLFQPTPPGRSPEPVDVVRTGVALYMGMAALSSFAWQTALGAPLAALLLGAAAPADCGTRRRMLMTRMGMAVAAAGSIAVAAWTMLDLMWTVRADVAAEHQRFHLVDRVPRWGHVYVARFGAEAANLARWSEAVTWLEEAWSGHREPSLLSNLAQAYGRVGRWTDAEELHRRWVRSGLLHERALHDWSLSLEALERYRDAAEAEERRLALWPPQDSFGYLRVAALHLKGGQPERALACTERRFPGAAAKRDRPGARFLEGEMRLFNLIGAAWLMKGSPEKARPWIAAVLRQDPTNATALANRELLLPAP